MYKCIFVGLVIVVLANVMFRYGVIVLPVPYRLVGLSMIWPIVPVQVWVSVLVCLSLLDSLVALLDAFSQLLAG